MLETVTLTSGALQSESLPAWSSQTPSAQDLAKFDQALATTDISPNIDRDLSQQVFKHFSDIDAKYHDLFTNQDNRAAIAGITSNDNAPAASGQNNIDNAAMLLKNFQSSIALQTEISVWSAQVNLLTSCISKSTQGVQTLFKNSG